MSAGPDAERRSPVLRFFDAFLREQNIKWMLGVGMLILLGSSLMLVTSHWDAYTPVWKHLVLLGYTAGLHLVGQVAYRSLGLRRTGTGLMALTVLLIPLTFLAFRWTHPGDALALRSIARQTGLLFLLAASFAFAVDASIRIFRHFLRRTQPTFVASYLVLCTAGVWVTSVPAAAAPWLALGLWGVFATGSIKVNRHVFWLTEAHRLPRIVGFFPILLLGGQFLMLFAAGLAPHVRIDAIGLGCVLSAIPILLTADALARVHLETRGSPRTLPWGVAVPMVVGLALTLTGVCLAGARFPDAPTLVPASALAAGLLGLTARRTGKRVFAWAMLAGIVLAYQSSPAFFRELARQAVRHGAAAVNEPRLPIAFYGLTYLPLLVSTSLAAAWSRRRGDAVFARALQGFSIGLPMLLLAASLSHAKAVFPVGLALCAMLAMEAGMFRSRLAAGLGVLAWCVAALGFGPFAIGVVGIAADRDLPILAWGIAGGLLLLPGAWFDRRMARWLPEATRDGAIPLCEWASRMLTLIAAVAWLAGALAAFPIKSASPVSGALLGGLLLVHAGRSRHPRWTDGALAFAVACPTLVGLAEGLSLESSATLATLQLIGLWIAAAVVEWRIGSALAALFADSARRIAGAGLCIAFVAYLVPSWGATLVGGEAFSAWMAATGVTAWMFAAARRGPGGWLTAGGWIGLLATAGCALVELGPAEARDWLPALWCALALTAMPWAYWRRGPLVGCVAATLAVVAGVSLAIYTTPIRVAGAIAFAGLLLTGRFGPQLALRDAAWMLAGWQALAGTAQRFAPHVRHIEAWSAERFAPAALPVALIAALQAILWQRRLRSDDSVPELAVVQRLGLALATGTALLCGFAILPNGLTPWQIAAASAAFSVLAADRILTAVRIAGLDCSGDTRRADSIRAEAETNVWAAELIVASGIAYLAVFGAIRFGHGLSLYVTLAAGLVAWGLAEAARRTPRHAVLAGPLTTTAMWVPAAAVALGVGRHVAGSPTTWLGFNSLALLLAAGFYFWRALEGRQPRLLIAAAAIVNAALALLWRELEWLDPQLFLIPAGASILALVEALRDEIPPQAHDPLRYVGALAILVSPTFHIVEGSWLHLFSLMALSVGVILAAIGARVKVLMYSGTAFLAADVVAMVVRGSIDEPSVLWIAGIALGGLVIGLAAYCERRREQMLQRLRLIAAELESWR